jgi:chlorobactene glucosyltransferase
MLTLLVSYLLLGPLAWAAMWFASVKGQKRMKIVRRPPPAIPAPMPMVTVLIPAKDEEARIEACVQSVLAQDYPCARVLAIDDRSADRTGGILDMLSVSHDRLRVIHIHPDELHPGWTGKCNALHRALPCAVGEWLAFVDSDVVLEPDALRCALAWAIHRRIDLLSLLCRMETGGFWESLIMPLGGAATAAMYLIALTNAPNHPRLAFASGHFILIRRDVYDAVGQHQAVRDCMNEDMELARRVKLAGYRPRLSIGTDLARVRMYSDLAGIVGGWSRNFYAGSHGRPWRILAAMAFVLICSVSAYGVLLVGVWSTSPQWIAAAAVHLAIMTGALAGIYRASGNRRSWALLFPLGAAMLLAIFVRSLLFCATGNVNWRGTQYRRRTPPHRALSGDST